MRILFDQGTPVPIRAYLVGHTVRTAYQEGWDKLRNGELLTAAEAAGFKLFLTTDKNIRYQQNLANRKILSCSASSNGRACSCIFSLLSTQWVREVREFIEVDIPYPE